MSDVSEVLASARSAFERHQWAEALEAFTRAAEVDDLTAEDTAALAESAWWTGAIDECLVAYEQAYHLFLRGDERDNRRAAMLALEIGFYWFLRGEVAIGSGWMSRAARLMEAEPDCVEHGYLLSLAIDVALEEDRYEEAMAVARQVAEVGRRYGDETLTALALVGEGVAVIKQGRVAEGTAILDEAMLPVVAGRVQAAYAGNIYCQLMSVCHELGEFGRAAEWTDATARWCEGFSSAVMFLGVCRVHRAQLLELRGEWDQAEEEALSVCSSLADLNVNAVGWGRYLLGEVQLRRGDLAGAEASYQAAHELGRDPNPGLARLRLAQGRVPEAQASIATAVDANAANPLVQARLLDAQVEIAIAAGDVDTARSACEALERIARTYESSGLLASSAAATGSVLVAEQQYDEAVRVLEVAARRWRDLDAGYLVARVRLGLAQAYRALDDPHRAALELDAAGRTFETLGATLDHRRAELLRARPVYPDGLTAREVEVLASLAKGLSNKELASELVVSEKTVARHLSNIFRKIGVSSRTAAAAYAFEHGLASRG